MVPGTGFERAITEIFRPKKGKLASSESLPVRQTLGYCLEVKLGDKGMSDGASPPSIHSAVTLWRSALEPRQ